MSSVNNISVVFFGFLFLMLFVGDGQSSHIDGIGAAFVFVFSLFCVLYAHQQRKPPKIVVASWLLFLFWCVVSSIFSTDIGVSVSAVIRYIEGFLVYITIYTYLPARAVGFFSNLLGFFGIAAVFTTGVLFVFPDGRSILPLMNLVWSGAGHNHVTDVWLLTLFSVVARFFKRSIQYFIVLITILVFVFSQARAALVVGLMGVSMFLYFCFRPTPSTKTLITILGIFSIFLYTTLLPPKTLPDGVRVAMGITRNKNSLFQERRVEYWQQAARATMDRPVFGFGPGTFSLISKRFQSNPQNSSWYAHNYVLEFFSEIGIFGGLLFLSIIFWSYIRPVMMLLRSQDMSLVHKALLWSPAMILVYGLVDFSLNYLVIWILFWAIIGASTHEKS